MAAYCDLWGVCTVHCVRVYPHTVHSAAFVLWCYRTRVYSRLWGDRCLPCSALWHVNWFLIVCYNETYIVKRSVPSVHARSSDYYSNIRRLAHIICVCIYIYIYTGCPRRNVKYFGRMFLMLNYTDITQNTYIQSWTVTKLMAIEKCGLLWCPRTVRRPWGNILHAVTLTKGF